MTTRSPDDEVLLEVEDGVALVTLNRPDRFNALIQSMMGRLSDVIENVAKDPNVGCVVITGAGRGFCGGGDLKSHTYDPAPQPATREAGSRIEQSIDQLGHFVRAARLLHDMPKPSIAMINGPCAGAGIGLAGACDLRFAGPDASFVTSFAGIGASGDFGSTYFWTKIVGTAVARELFLLSEKLDAKQAFEKGLYTRLLTREDLRPYTLAAARKLAAGPRMAWRYMKQNLNAAETESFHSVIEREVVNMVLAAHASAAIRKSERAESPVQHLAAQEEQGG